MKKNNLVLTGISSSGKSFFFSNFKHIFNQINSRAEFPDNIGTRDNCFYFEGDGDILFNAYYYTLKDGKYKTLSEKEFKSFSKEDHLNFQENSKFLLFVRDPRVIWFVDDHYDQIACNPEHLFTKLKIEINKFMTMYKFIKTNNFDYYIVRFEDYQNSFKEISDKLAKFLEIEELNYYMRSSIQANYYLTSTDFFEKFSFFSVYNHILNKEDLDIISDEFKNFILEFEYKRYLYKQDIMSNLSVRVLDHIKEEVLTSAKYIKKIEKEGDKNGNSV